MRGGYRVNAVKIERWEKVEEYHQAQSANYKSKLYTTCGHKHATREEAQACVPAVEAEYRAKRWPKRAL